MIGDQLTVFYNDQQDFGLAEKVANYFRDHKLLTGKEQAVQLHRSNKLILLKLIATDSSSLKAMPFEEKKLLLSFQENLNQEVQPDKPISLVICDDRFKPIFYVDP